MEEILKRGQFWLAYLNQGEWWLPNAKPRMHIADMEDRHRTNAAAWMLRQARMIQFCYTVAEQYRMYAPMMVVIREVDGKPVEQLDRGAFMGPMPGSMAADALDEELRQRLADPVAWLESTTLYKALVDIRQE
jgi:hypothetical protein